MPMDSKERNTQEAVGNMENYHVVVLVPLKMTSRIHLNAP